MSVASQSSYNKKKEAEEWTKNCPLVGRESQVNELRKYTLKARLSVPSVMCVWGIAGVGKSALVKHMYCDGILHRETSHKYLWVDISRPFNLRGFYRSLLPDFHSEKDPIEECHSLLQQDRCLIVIDDLRSKEEWDLIEAALVYKMSRSVIVVITTEESIARYCTRDEDLIYSVKPLEAATALDVFKLQVEKSKHEDLKVDELILKSGGLPIVIAAIAGLLARKSNSAAGIVHSLNHKFMHHLETCPEYESLQDLFYWMHSHFRSCPDSLKPCISYLPIFPLGHIIRRRRLVRRWIAEGYSRDGHNETAEQNGEKHFSELLGLSIFQLPPQLVTTAFDDTKMVFCQVNGFMREYIVSQQKGENLVFELDEKCVLTTQPIGRHLAILESWGRDRIVYESMDFSRLRSLTVFGTWKPFLVSKSMNMLRVLDLEDASGLEDADLGRMFEYLRRLKFLSLRGCREIHHLPNSIGDLRQLQTLDVRDTSIVALPVKITKLQKLQYIRAGTTTQATSTPQVSSNWLQRLRRRHRWQDGVEVSRGIGNLNTLYTLGVVNIVAGGRKGIVEDIKKLTQLRKLGVAGVNGKNIKDFESAISCHVHLESLSMQLDKDNQECSDAISLPCQNLRSLKLFGLQDRLPRFIKHLSKLTKLDLKMNCLVQSDMDLLGRLPKLCIMCLAVNQPSLAFYTELYGLEQRSLGKVKILEIACTSSELHVTFGSLAMKNLELLKVDCSSGSSYKFSGLEHLSELKKVLLMGDNDETLKADLVSQLASHPRKPAVVKLDGPLGSS